MNLEKIFNVGYRGYPDGSVSFYSTRIKELTGYDLDDFNSKRINWVTDLMNPDDIQNAKAALKAGLKGDMTYARWYRIRTKSGPEKWVLELAQIICDTAGKLEAVTGALIDITDEKLEEFALQRLNRLTGKYLIVSLNGQQYGIPILKVREIVNMLSITPVPNVPCHVKGVVNLRGKVIPVVDLCRKFDMERTGETDQSCIVIIEASGMGRVVLGTVVDSVSEVMTIKGADIEDAPERGLSADTKFLLGIAKVGQDVKLLLDIDKLFSADEFGSIAGAA